MKATIISITNQKGGVGKTTTAINLAAYLSEKGYRVLLIDLDSQANATSGVGLKKDEIDKSVYDLIINNISVTDVLYPTPFENLNVIPSTRDLAGAEVDLVHMVSRETILKQRVQSLKEHYNYIIIVFF
jgi:chromosome partitioning protein